MINDKKSSFFFNENKYKKGKFDNFSKLKK